MSPDAFRSIKFARLQSRPQSPGPGGDDPEARAAAQEAWRAQYFERIRREEIPRYSYKEPDRADDR